MLVVILSGLLLQVKKQVAWIQPPTQRGETRHGTPARNWEEILDSVRQVPEAGVDGWSDMGLGDFELGYLRDKEKREVDFLVARDGKPWFLVEVKQRDEKVGTALEHYQRQLDTPHAFQVVLDADYVGADCFAKPRGPLVVPARTFLSQLL